MALAELWSVICFAASLGTGVRGDPKKEGAGGKGAWGTSMEAQGPAALDSKDPNYDSGAEKTDANKA